jgi:hypothetical protein
VDNVVRVAGRGEDCDQVIADALRSKMKMLQVTCAFALDLCEAWREFRGACDVACFSLFWTAFQMRS